MIFRGLVVFVLLIDQLTKYLVRQYMVPWESITVYPGVLYLTYVQNPGAAFGILANWTGLFIIVAVLLVLGIFLFWPRIMALTWGFQLALALEVGGAIGNLIDRLCFGQVIVYHLFGIRPPQEQRAGYSDYGNNGDAREDNDNGDGI